MNIFKHNFWGKVIISTGVLLTMGGSSIVSAATTDTDNSAEETTNNPEETTSNIDVRKGKGTWTIDNAKVYGGGSWSRTTKSNLKKTNGNSASFNGDAMPAVLGYVVKLVNNKNSTRSDSVSLALNHTVHANNNSGLAGYHYWASIRSNIAEPHTTTVKLHFSADRK